MIFALLHLCACEQNQPMDCYTTTLTQAGMNQCAFAHEQKAKVKLDDLYKKLMAKMSPAGQTELESARNAWTTYRAKECEFESFGTVTGSIHPMIISQCYANITNDYSKVLQRQLDCVEGDLSCGGQ